MPSSAGPKLPNRDNLLFVKQPGILTGFDTNASASYASDVVTPTKGAIIGPRRTFNAGYGNAYDDRFVYNDNLGSPLALVRQIINVIEIGRAHV